LFQSNFIHSNKQETINDANKLSISKKTIVCIFFLAQVSSITVKLINYETSMIGV